jgi:hypothetical protein
MHSKPTCLTYGIDVDRKKSRQYDRVNEILVTVILAANSHM